MKILLIGASGTVGTAVDKELSTRHEIIRIGRTSGDFQVDISDSASIRALFEKTGTFDALVCAAGSVTFAPLAEMTEQSFALGLQDKLMGQVNLLLIGHRRTFDEPLEFWDDAYLATAEFYGQVARWNNGVDAMIGAEPPALGLREQRPGAPVMAVRGLSLKSDDRDLDRP